MKKKKRKARGPNLKLEKDLQQQGYLVIAGVDEAGRGAWAGPVVAAAVILPFLNRYYGINDSKLLSLEEREEILEKIYELAVDIGIGVVENEDIDRMGVGQASYLAMRRAVSNLSIKPWYVLVDGFKVGFSEDVDCCGVLDGDKKSVSIAAASIVAKVARDRIMGEVDKEYMDYGFKSHKGYGTAFHQLQLKKCGLCKWHRKSFKPIKNYISIKANLEIRG